jgi:hypothetical protein
MIHIKIYIFNSPQRIGLIAIFDVLHWSRLSNQLIANWLRE